MITRDWWRRRRCDFDLRVSQFVLDEAADADSTVSAERLSSLAGIEILHVTEQAEMLASELEISLSLPKKALLDAAHISIAACHKMDFLLTWNCRHINNAQRIPIIEKTCRSFGVSCPVICTPEELMGYE